MILRSLFNQYDLIIFVHVFLFITFANYLFKVIAMYIVNPTGTREAAQSKPEEFISIN